MDSESPRRPGRLAGIPYSAGGCRGPRHPGLLAARGGPAPGDGPRRRGDRVHRADQPQAVAGYGDRPNRTPVHRGRGRSELDWVRPRLVLPLAFALASGLAVVAWEAFTAAGSASAGAVWSYLTTGLAGLARLSRLALEAVALFGALAQAPSLWLVV